MKVGIIGAGGISAHHARAFNSLGIEITAVADINRDAFSARRELYGNAKYYSSAEELLSDPSVDIADVCVGTRWHFDIIRQSAAAGKHIFCEKTMTDGEANSRQLMELLANYPKNFQIGYMKRFFPATNKAVELLPVIGEIVSSYIISYQVFELTNDLYNTENWKPKDGKPSRTRNYACGGMMNMAGSHMLDLMNLLLGEVASIYSLNWSPPDYDAETNSHALFRMQHGNIVHFEAATSPYSRDGLWRDGWDERIRINGKRGNLRIFFTAWDKPQHNAPILQLYSETEKLHSEFTFPKIDAFHEQMAYFIKNCRAGTKSRPGIKEGYYVDRIIAACYASAESGKVICF